MTLHKIEVDYGTSLELGVPQGTYIKSDETVDLVHLVDFEKNLVVDMAQKMSIARLECVAAEEAAAGLEQEILDLRAKIEGMRQDNAHLHQFHLKHALGPKMPPSCLVCGQQTLPSELESDHSVVIQHAELRGIVVCKSCVDAVRGGKKEAMFVEEIKWLKERVEHLKTVKFQRFNNDDCWIYQGDGQDYLESLACPVVISPEKLMEILKK